MKNYIKELIVLLLQLIVFYILPLFSGPTDMIGLVFLIIILTFILSIIMGIISDNKVKYLYSIIISILFIPSIFIYYNESAIMYVIWYFLDSSIGLLVGTIIKKILRR